MLFVVTYRGKSGAMCEERVEAPDRAACVTALKARGLMPVRIAETSGAGAPRIPRGGANARAARSAKTAFYLATVITAVLVTIGLRSWVARDVGEGRAPAPGPTAPRDGGKGVVKDAAGGSMPAPRPSPVRGRPLSGATAPEPITAANAGGTENGQVPGPRRVPEELLDKTPVKRPFKTGVEQVLSLMFTTHVGSMPFPLPRLSDDEVARIWDILNTDVPVTDEDDAASALCKETVAVVKKEMADFLKRGSGTPRDFLQHYQKILVDAHREYMAACSECERVKEEQPEIFNEFLASVNKHLAEKGIRPVVVEDDSCDGGDVSARSADTKDAKEGD